MAPPGSRAIHERETVLAALHSGGIDGDHSTQRSLDDHWDTDGRGSGRLGARVRGKVLEGFCCRRLMRWLEMTRNALIIGRLVGRFTRVSLKLDRKVAAYY